MTILLLSAGNAPAQTAQPSTEAVRQLQQLRDSLDDAYNKGDVDRMLTYLHPDVLIVFPDGEVLHGREALRGYYDRMLNGAEPIVSKYTANPVVDGRQIRGEVDLSWGRMNDHYVLTNGFEFGLDSRFTATLLQSPDGPPETGGWMIRSFHSSTDTFDNPVLKHVAKKSFIYGGLAGIVIGVLASGLIVLLLRKRAKNRVMS